MHCPNIFTFTLISHVILLYIYVSVVFLKTNYNKLTINDIRVTKWNFMILIISLNFCFMIIFPMDKYLCFYHWKSWKHLEQNSLKINSFYKINCFYFRELILNNVITPIGKFHTSVLQKYIETTNHWRNWRVLVR